MSQERRQRQQERQGDDAAGAGRRNIIVIAVVIVVVFAVAVFLLRRNHPGRLDAFAQCLTAKQAKMYGAYWCPHCSEQKELFDSSFEYAPYIECGVKGSKGLALPCTQAGIQRFPTWVFADGTRVEGKQQLTFLSDKTGCPLP